MTGDEIEQVFDQLEALAQRQFPDDELGRLRFMVNMLKTRIREGEYRAERASKMLRDTLNPGDEK